MKSLAEGRAQVGMILHDVDAALQSIFQHGCKTSEGKECDGAAALKLNEDVSVTAGKIVPARNRPEQVEFHDPKLPPQVGQSGAKSGNGYVPHHLGWYDCRYLPSSFTALIRLVGIWRYSRNSMVLLARPWDMPRREVV